MKQWDAATVGEIFVDHVFSGLETWPQPGEEVYAAEYVREVGGGAAITACALAKLGRNVAAFGVVGHEEEWLDARLAGFGVSLDGLEHSQISTAVSMSISTREDRSFFTYRGANEQLPSYLAKPEVQAMIALARHVHFAMPIDPVLGEILLPYLKAEGCVLSLDPGYQLAWFGDVQCRRLCRYIDYFLPNEKEGQLMTGCSEPSGILSALEGEQIPNSVLKLGRAGAALLEHGQLRRATSPPVNAVDTTGAGDAFDAGLIDALLDAMPLTEAMERACICGSLSTRASGALNALPDRDELDTCYEQLKQLPS